MQSQLAKVSKFRCSSIPVRLLVGINKHSVLRAKGIQIRMIVKPKLRFSQWKFVRKLESRMLFLSKLAGNIRKEQYNKGKFI